MTVKKVLIVQYSQSGQLTDVVTSVTAPLLASNNIELQTLTLKPVNPYPFPWPILSFFNIFPECVYLDPPELQAFNINKDEKFDLIILSYQVWFLAPSLPITAFLQSTEGKQLLKDTPVITLIACRNMWIMAQQAVQQMLDNAGAQLLDNIVLVDQGSILASFITTPRWLLTGKKNAFWGFPEAGISKTDIAAAERFGDAICDALSADKEKQHQPLLSGLGAVSVDVSLLQSEKAGYRSFRIWGKLLRLIGKPGNIIRKIVLIFYIIFLVALIITVVPVTMLLNKILQPVFKKKIQKLKTYYELPSGSDINRIKKPSCQK